MLRNRMFLSVCAVCFAFPAALRAQQPNVDPIPVGNVAERLGVKLMPSAPIELDFGHSVTAMLADPGKIGSLKVYIGVNQDTTFLKYKRDFYFGKGKILFPTPSLSAERPGTPRPRGRRRNVQASWNRLSPFRRAHSRLTRRCV